MNLQLPGPKIISSSSDRCAQNSVSIDIHKLVLDQFFIPTTTISHQIRHRSNLRVVRHDQWTPVKMIWNPPVMPDTSRISITNPF
jgi:hypothetical protein